MRTTRSLETAFLCAALLATGAASAQAGFGERRVEHSLAADINHAGRPAFT